MLTDLKSVSGIGLLIDNFAIKLLLQIPSSFDAASTLPCEILT